MIRRYLQSILSVCLVLMTASATFAQYTVNQKIEAEDLEATDIDGNSWLRTGHGEGWLDHSSDFIYAMCGNRHWLCDSRVIERCKWSCADEYVEAPIDILTTGYYVIYAYIAVWSDSATIPGNEGCEHESKWEACNWFVGWDDPTVLDKIYVDQNWNVPVEQMWSFYPYDTFCGQFALDTVIMGHEREDCADADPRGCDFPTEEFFLIAGEHTLYLKVADEYALIDWIMVSGVDDPVPAAEPGRAYEPTAALDRPMVTPAEFSLSQNYPNPFNPGTVIEYHLPQRAEVELVVFDVSGREVSVLVEGVQSSGPHSVYFEAGDLPSGIYLYRLDASCATCGNGKRLYSSQGKMVYLK